MIPVTIFHCNEITLKSQIRFSAYPFIYFFDLCENKIKMDIFDSFQNQTARLAGFFCKPAALIHSPYQETIMTDIDIIWLNKPDYLFDFVGYQKTGSLFFRDRLISSPISFVPEPIYAHIRININNTIKLIQTELNISNIDNNIATQLANENGYSLFWNHRKNPNELPLIHIQDSSVLLLDKSRHLKTLEVIHRLLPTFKIGYGDKEIYWIAATIAREEFTWEPYLFASYGDCGALMHYDPRYDIQRTTPYFINAEYLLECVFRAGQDLSKKITAPVKVTENMKLFSLGNTDPVTKGRCDACKHMTCLNTTEYINAAIKEAQEIRLKNSNFKLVKCMRRRRPPKRRPKSIQL